MSKNKKKKKQVNAQKNPQPKIVKEPFNCLRCGYCCIYSTPSFTREEYKEVRDLKVTRDRNVKFTKVRFEQVIDRLDRKRAYQGYSYFTESGIKTLNTPRGCTPPPCEYLNKDEEGKCSCAIYAHRPSVCRDFGVKEWTCPNNPDYLKKTTKGGCLFLLFGIDIENQN